MSSGTQEKSWLYVDDRAFPALLSPSHFFLRTENPEPAIVPWDHGCPWKSLSQHRTCDMDDLERRPVREKCAAAMEATDGRVARVTDAHDGSVVAYALDGETARGNQRGIDGFARSLRSVGMREIAILYE